MPDNASPPRGGAKPRAIDIELEPVDGVYVDAPHRPADIAFDTPTGGALAQASQPESAPLAEALRAAPRRQAGHPLPGRDYAAGEAAGWIGQAGASVAAEAADFAASLGDMRDEISTEQAMAFARNRQAHAVPGYEDRLRLANPVGAPNVPALPEVRPPRTTLPALVSRAVFAPDPNWSANVTAEIRWSQIYDLPGFYKTQIRGLGRAIFRHMPCFVRQEELMTPQGQDPLGAVRVLANINGAGPSSQAELDLMARWIRANGVAVDGARMEFANYHGYCPRIVLSCDEHRSYLLVQERRPDCPMNGDYIYSWEGGLSYYRDNLLAIQTLARECDGLVGVRDVPTLAVGGGRGQQRAIAAPANPARGGGARPRRGGAAAPGLMGLAGDGAAEAAALPPAVLKGQGKDKLAGLATAPTAAVTSAAVATLRSAGFRPFGTPDGPALRKAFDDGRTAVVYGESGKSLATSDVLRLKVVEADGSVSSDDALADPADADIGSVTAFRMA